MNRSLFLSDCVVAFFCLPVYPPQTRSLFFFLTSHHSCATGTARTYNVCHSNFSSYFFCAQTLTHSVEVLIDKRNNQLSAKTCRTRSYRSHSFKSKRQTDRYRFGWHFKWPISMSLMSNSKKREEFSFSSHSLFIL
jgi:hypothetical protein